MQRRSLENKRAGSIGSPTTLKRSSEKSFMCKICERVLSGENFYERHLQCISCQMAINSVARTMKVQHHEAKSAYIEAIREAPGDNLADLESYRNALHKDAENRMKRSLAEPMEQVAEAGTPGQATIQPGGRPRRTSGTAKRATDETSSPCKRRRTGVRHIAEVEKDDTIDAKPCHGLLMLLKACEKDLDALEASQAERCWSEFKLGVSPVAGQQRECEVAAQDLGLV